MLLLTDHGRIGYEDKYSDRLRVTRSLHTAMEVWQLADLRIVYPGVKDFALTEKIRAVGFDTLMASLAS